MSRQDKITDLLEFSERLRAARKRTGLNQADFAALGGVVMNSQNRYEAGATEPGRAYFANLATAGVDVVFILTGRHQADSLEPDASELVGLFRTLEARDRNVLLVTARAMASGEPIAKSAPRDVALHDDRSRFRSSTD